MTKSQQEFIEVFVDELLNAPEFANITDETRAEYKPQLVAEAERRIGLAVLPLLDEAGAEAFTRILQSEDPAPADMEEFLRTHVPNIDDVMQKTLKRFAEEFKKLSSEQ